MCVVSVIYDSFSPMPDSWFNQERIDLFKRMVDDARKFDQEAGQPDCEDAEKAKLLARIKELEVYIKNKSITLPEGFEYSKEAKASLRKRSKKAKKILDNKAKKNPKFKKTLLELIQQANKNIKND